jgi:hypothetical protein
LVVIVGANITVIHGTIACVMLLLYVVLSTVVVVVLNVVLSTVVMVVLWVMSLWAVGLGYRQNRDVTIALRCGCWNHALVRLVVIHVCHLVRMC